MQLESVILNNIESGIAILNADFTYKYVNKVAAAHINKRPEEIISKSVNDILDPVAAIKLIEAFGFVKEKGVGNAEVLIGGKWILCNISLLPEQEEELFMIQEKDISDIKQEELKSYKFAQLINNSNDCIGIADTEGGILFINKPGCDMMDINDFSLIKGRYLSDVVAEADHGKLHEVLLPELYNNGTWSGEVLLKNFKTGLPMSFHCNSFIIKDPATTETRYIAAILRDLTEYKENEAKLKASLHEKEILLAEIHHRVKNNLAIVSGLLALQAYQMQDEQVESIIQDCQHRIQTMALIHEMLYQSETFSLINMREYIKELAESLATSLLSNDSAISIQIEIEEVYLSITMAVPLGLIANELISNAFKHAFNGMDCGKLVVRLVKNEDNLLLRIEDNGKGFPEEFDIMKSDRLGFKIIVALTDQLQGQFSIDSNTDSQGSCTQLSFKDISEA